MARGEVNHVVSANRTIISAIAAAFTRGFRRMLKDLGQCPISLFSHADACDASRRGGSRVTVTVDENQECIGGSDCNSISNFSPAQDLRKLL